METGYALHCIEYRHDGRTCVLEIPATSQEDAWQRICRLQQGTYLGEVQLVVPARLGIVARAYAGLMNLFQAGGRSRL